MSASNKPKPDDPGLLCPDCGCPDSRVYYTRARWGGRRIRRRICRHCGRKYTSVEKVSG